MLDQRILRVMFLGVVALVAAALAVSMFVDDFDIRIPEDTVREAIAEKIPLTPDLGPDLNMTISDADVDFRGGGDSGGVAITVDVKLSGLGLSGSVQADTFSSVRYEDGAFYLSDLRLEDFEITPSLASRAKLAAMRKAFETFLDQIEADIAADDDGDSLRKFQELRVVVGPVLLEMLDENLGNIPIYRLGGDAKQSAVKLILKDVAFDDVAAIATLSPSKAIVGLATFALTLVVLVLLSEIVIRLRNGADSSSEMGR